MVASFDEDPREKPSVPLPAKTAKPKKRSSAKTAEEKPLLDENSPGETPLSETNGEMQSEIVTRRGSRKRIVTLRGQATTKDFLLFSEFPFATLSDGRGKKDAMQVANRIEREWDVVDPQSGKTVRARWQVNGDEELGLPTAQDEMVYLVLMQLSREQGFPERVTFTRHELLKRLKWGEGAERYEDIEFALRRLSGVRIFAQNVVRPIPGKPGSADLGTTGFSLIGDFYLRKERPGRKKKRPAPGSNATFTEAGAEKVEVQGQEMPGDEPRSHFSWSRPLQGLLREGQVRSLDLEFILALHRPISRRLARYLGKKAYDGKESFEIGVELLCARHLGMTPSPHESVFKQRLKAAHEELIDNTFLTRVTFSDMKSRSGHKIRYDFGPRAFDLEEDPALSPPPGALASESADDPQSAGQPELPFDGPITPEIDAEQEITPTATQTGVESPANAQKEAASASAEAPVIALVEQIGVSGAVTRELLEKFGALALEAQLACLSDREPRDAAATFVKAVRESWAPPAAYQSRLEAQERDLARRAAREEDERRKSAQAQSEQQERDRQSAENDHLDALWEKLDAPLRERLEREAVEKLGILGRTGRAQAALVAMRRAVLRERFESLQDDGEE